MQGRVWVLNDNSSDAPPSVAQIYLIDNGIKTKLADISTDSVTARENGKFGEFEFTVPAELSERFTVALECADHPEWNSYYDLVHNSVASESSFASEDTNNDDFSDFLS